MIPGMDRPRDVLASLSLILAARGLGCAQTELGKKQLYRTVLIGNKYFIIHSVQSMDLVRFFFAYCQAVHGECRPEVIESKRKGRRGENVNFARFGEIPNTVNSLGD
jgi:hypothetical protein